MDRKDKIKVTSYNRHWPFIFKKEALKIKKALDNICLAIHHIGSTSIKHLAAKPIIDMVVVVADITEVDTKCQPLSFLGYKARGENGIPFRRYFQKKRMGKAFHLHIFAKGNLEIERHLQFRDWMRFSQEDRKAYGALKKKLALLFPHDRHSYCLGKEPFISQIEDKYGWQGFRMVRALTPKEWNAYHRIREEQLFNRSDIVYDRNHFTLKAANHFHFVLYKGSEIVAVAQVEFLREEKAALRSLATDEPYKSKGFGKTMLQLIEKWLLQRGKKVLQLHAALPAENFYRKLGYSEMPFDDPSILPKKIDLGKIL